MILLLLLAAAPVHVKVYEEPGRFGGWPANHGIWSWGDEILCGFSGAFYQTKSADRHQYDNSKPELPYFARSLDGGQSWSIERPEFGSIATKLAKPMDFTAPGFAMTIRLLDNHTGPSRFWFATDRGRHWNGPYEFPDLGFPGIAARTDYIINGKQDAYVFVTAAKQNKREGRPIVAHTSDGGLSWSLRSTIGGEPDGFAIMPSTVRLSKTDLITTVRVKATDTDNWIEQFNSFDNARTWTSAGKIAATGAYSGNPPHLMKLKDGRLCLTYGYRSKPYSIRAKLSSDNGKTWSGERLLRDDGAAWDLGYVRSVERPDGSVVTLYYFNDAPHRERFIAATIWRP